VRYNRHLYKFCCTSSAGRSRAAASGQDNVIRQRHTTRGPTAPGSGGALALGGHYLTLAAPSRPSEEPLAHLAARESPSAVGASIVGFWSAKLYDNPGFIYPTVSRRRGFAGRGVGSIGVLKFDFPIVDGRCEREGSAANLYSALLGFPSSRQVGLTLRQSDWLVPIAPVSHRTDPGSGSRTLGRKVLNSGTDDLALLCSQLGKYRQR
jgi:hypothetical protein